MDADRMRGGSERRVSRLVRAGWLLFLGWIVLFAVLSFPARYAHLSTTPYGLGEALFELGVPLPVFAGYVMLLEFVLLVVCLGVATVVAWQRSDDWFALLVAFTLALAPMVTPLPDSFVQQRPAWQPVLIAVRFLGAAGLITTMFLFPDARFVPRWLRWVLPVALALLALSVYRDPNHMLDTAVFATSRPAETAWLILPIVPAFLAGMAAQIYRYRHASPAMQQQIKWVLFGFAAVCAAFALTGITLALLPLVELGPAARATFTLIAIALTLFALMLLPLSMALAMLRAGLWDIDLIINRAAVYSLLTAGLTALYFGLTVVLQGVLQGLTGEASSLAIVISTLAIAVLFAPFRRRLQDGIDRRFYRRKYNAALMLERFARQAQAEVDLESLADDVIEVVRESVQPDSVGLWLRPTRAADSNPQPGATRPKPATT
jgi:hypothetical protein